ncbi:MAG: response regulator [Archangium sp.]|nr:response regulator [Archangium sp.]
MHRILLVEDEEAVARALERWLKRRKVEVRVLLDPTEVGAALADFAPTIVVTDLHMPARSGLEVLAEVKDKAPNAIRALLSGSLQSLPAKDLLDLQPLRLIAKPWNTATLARDLGLDDA